MLLSMGAQIQGTRSLGRLNIFCWRLIYMARTDRSWFVLVFDFEVAHRFLESVDLLSTILFAFVK
jgi:hypothetical protein